MCEQELCIPPSTNKSLPQYDANLTYGTNWTECLGKVTEEKCNVLC
jgi:hypothetical protein